MNSQDRCDNSVFNIEIKKDRNIHDKSESNNENNIKKKNKSSHYSRLNMKHMKTQKNK